MVGMALLNTNASSNLTQQAGVDGGAEQYRRFSAKRLSSLQQNRTAANTTNNGAVDANISIDQ